MQTVCFSASDVSTSHICHYPNAMEESRIPAVFYECNIWMFLTAQRLISIALQFIEVAEEI